MTAPPAPGAAALAAIAIGRIEAAFAGRAPPDEITDSLQLSDAEYAEVTSFEGLHWRDVTWDHLDRAPDAVFWFSPAAFCFHLPGAMLAGLQAGKAGLTFYDSILGCLDRSPEPAWWDDFFAPRFTRLTRPEIDAVAAWLDWLEAVEPDEMASGAYDRARVTLALLKERAPAA